MMDGLVMRLAEGDHLVTVGRPKPSLEESDRAGAAGLARQALVLHASNDKGEIK